MAVKADDQPEGVEAGQRCGLRGGVVGRGGQDHEVSHAAARRATRDLGASACHFALVALLVAG